MVIWYRCMRCGIDTPAYQRSVPADGKLWMQCCGDFNATPITYRHTDTPSMQPIYLWPPGSESSDTWKPVTG